MPTLQAGSFEVALGLLAEAEAAAVDELQRARVEQLRGQVARVSDYGREAPVRLLRAAVRLESLDLRLARDSYLHALFASIVAGRLAQPGGRLLEVARAARSVAPPTPAPLPRDLLLDGMATMIIDGRAAAEPTLRRAVHAFLRDQISTDDWAQWGLLGTGAAVALWDFDSWAVMSDRHLGFARASGALAPLSAALNAHRVVATFCGDFETAASLGLEENAVKEVTGVRIASYGGMLLAAYQGRPVEARNSSPPTPMTRSPAGTDVASISPAGRQRSSTTVSGTTGRHCSRRSSGRGRLRAVLREGAPGADRGRGQKWRAALAADGLRRLSATVVEGSDWVSGLQARSRALLSDGEPAERCYVEAVERLGRTRLRPDLARAHLLYGEWLRRESRRVDARHQLRTAYDMFAGMGAQAFADRARRELLATGEKLRKREVDTQAELTSQEEHIARLARDGRTNPEIAAELFLSARTVEWHLRKVFTKLRITSRKDLGPVLAAHGRSTTHE